MKATKKTFIMFLVVVLLAVSMPVNGLKTVNAAEAAHLIINQVYGGGGKGETPITNSFIELYNPTQESVSLNGYSIVCGDATLSLSGNDIIKPGSSYLIVGNKEDTTDEWITYDLPSADKTWEYTINNKNYTISLKNGEVTVDEAVADSSVANLKISKQKSLRRINYTDTDSQSDWEIVVWEKESVTVDQVYVDTYAPHNSKGEKGSVHSTSEEQEPVYTPVEASDKKVTGYNNGNSSLDMEQFARYNSGALNADGGSLEIVDYNYTNGDAYAVNGLKGKIIAVPLSQVENGDTVAELSGTEYDVKELVSSKEGFAYGDITSVSVSPDGKKLAAAVQHADYDKAGMVAVFDCNTDGSLTNPIYVETGVQPDMVIFADDNTILTADEGEPRNGYGDGCTDPKGSVSIVTLTEDISGQVSGNSVQVGFEGFTAEELTAKNVILGKAAVGGDAIAPEYDLEPEYIAVSSDGTKAYVSLQEANAIGVLDVPQAKFTGVYSIGFERYSKVAVDLKEDGKYEVATYENLVGARMPDGIALYENNGKTYLVTANEGDAREWGDYLNEAKTKEFTGKNIRILNSELCAGLPEGKSVMFGGRGFSVFEVNANGLTEVYDSGNDFEKITGEKIPDYFNCSNDDNETDSRSPKKGPEPENVTVGTVNGKTFAFVAVERIGGVMVYDITNPAKTTYVNYINSREFDTEMKGDVSPEGLCFVTTSKSGNPMLLAACEVSGTLAVYDLKAKSQESEGEAGTGNKPTGDVSGNLNGDNSQNANPNGNGKQNPNGNETQNPNGSSSQNPDGNQKQTENGNASQEDTTKVAVGTVVADKTTKAEYKVTSAESGKLTVSYEKSTAKSAKKIEIPATVALGGVTYKVTSVADKAFLNNKKVTQIKVGKNVTTIGVKAFKGCKKLTKITLSSKTTKIGNNAFEGCTALKSITLPSKVSKIGSNVFKGCKNLKTITIKSSKLTKKNVSKNAFKGVPTKATVKVPKKKVSSYTKIFRDKGLSKKVKVKKY